MSKAILISIKPKWIAKILNGEKTIEIRKKFPSDYVGWVYIYCTKEQGLARLNNGSWNDTFITEKEITKDNFKHIYSGYDGKGKVVARFWCDKVEEIKYHFGYYDMGEWAESYILENSCLTAEELDNYLQASKEYDEKKVSRVYGYAIHITKLEIFTKPKGISEFKYYKKFSDIDYMLPIPRKETCERLVALTRAPQSWCYIEA